MWVALCVKKASNTEILDATLIILNYYFVKLEQYKQYMNMKELIPPMRI